MAVPAPEPGLPVRVHGLHPLQGQGGREDTEPGGLCGAGRHNGRVQGDTQHHGRGQRELQVLDGDAGRPEEPRGAADTISVEKESLGQGIMESAAVPALFRRHL